MITSETGTRITFTRSLTLSTLSNLTLTEGSLQNSVVKRCQVSSVTDRYKHRITPELAESPHRKDLDYHCINPMASSDFPRYLMIINSLETPLFDRSDRCLVSSIHSISISLASKSTIFLPSNAIRSQPAMLVAFLSPLSICHVNQPLSSTAYQIAQSTNPKPKSVGLSLFTQSILSVVYLTYQDSWFTARYFPS